MRRRITLAALIGVPILAITVAKTPTTSSLAGVVTDAAGRTLANVLVTARDVERGIAVTVTTDGEGRYLIPELAGGRYRLEARKFGFAPRYRDVELAPAAEVAVPVKLERVADLVETAPSSMFLSLLPDGETKRRFILDCTGCHPFDRKTVEKDGRPKSRQDWLDRTHQMLFFAGAASAFPIMSPSRDAESTADWLVAHLGSERLSLSGRPDDVGVVGKARITEYDLPQAMDLPHDVAVAADGTVLITGMSSHQMYVLDPITGAFSMRPIPVANANPRAVDIDRAGNWWVLLGAPRQLARFDPRAEEWKMYDLGMYPHSVALDPVGRVWFNGHFTKSPELIGFAHPDSGSRTFEVPVDPMPDGGSTIPYGMRVGPDGVVWATQLVGNRLIRFDPRTEEFRLYPLPTSFSGPRRLDVGPDGTVWVPEYAGNKLVRFDPASERFGEYPFPIADALPYVVRVDPRRGTVWIGTAAGDVVASFDPVSERFTLYPLPTPGALIRHIDIDESTGAVWGAYSPAPVVHARVFRLEPAR